MDINAHKVLDYIIINFTDIIKDEEIKQLNELFLKYYNQGEKKFIFNFKHTSFISSSGLGRVIYLNRKLLKENGILKLIELEKKLTELLLLTKLDKKIEIFKTLEDALC